jgi:hypothetical protein
MSAVPAKPIDLMHNEARPPIPDRLDDLGLPRAMVAI